MKILITGSNGFLGSNISKFLYEKKYNVTCLINEKNNNVENFNTIKHDLTLEIPFNEYFDFVIHAAATPSSKECIKNPNKGFENIKQTFNILEFCKRNNIPNFIFFSSCEVYGKGGENIEDSQLKSINMYGASKVSCEHMCSAYHYSYGLNVVIFRILNTWGEKCQKDRFPTIVQENFLNKTTPHFVIKTREKKRWLHVDDMCEKIFKVMNKFPKFEIFNLVGDENLTMVEFISKFGTNFTFEYSIEEDKGYCNDFNANGSKLFSYLE